MSKTTDKVIEVMNELKDIEQSNENNQQERIRLIKKARDFWNTPFDELIAQGYGVIEDPKSALKAELKEVQSKPWFPGQGGMIKKLKKQLNK